MAFSRFFWLYSKRSAENDERFINVTRFFDTILNLDKTINTDIHELPLS